MDNQAQRTVNGSWFRWSGYRVVNGVVCRTPDSELIEYDPWDQFHANARKYRTVLQPYVPFLQLAAQIRAIRGIGLLSSDERADLPETPEERFSQSPDPQLETELILKWCGEYGLLGLLPSLYRSVEFAPAVVEYEREMVAGELDVARFSCERWRYENFSGAWRRYMVWQGGLPSALCTEPEAQEISMEEAFLNPPRAFRQTRSSFPTIEPEPVTSDVPTGKYFPTRPEAMNGDQPVPLPLLVSNQPKLYSGERTAEITGCLDFELHYGEPLVEISETCLDFEAEAVDFSTLQDEDGPESAFYKMDFPLGFFAGLAQSAGQAFRLHPKTLQVREERVSAGLLSSYALMMLWDRGDNRRVKQCEVCGAYFMSDDYRACYCQPRCRNTAQARRYRRKQAGKQ